MNKLNPNQLFQGFKITNYYKYLLYIGGVTLVLSLFLEVKMLDVNVLRTICLYVIGTGLIMWLSHAIEENINLLAYEKYLASGSMEKYYLKFTPWLIGSFMFFHLLLLVTLITLIAIIL